ncbi:MAG: hypothetical protein GXY88_02720 [Tissierellia bacterium]|nr:hypothetical protein [Tissierellia bacterium]
MDAKKKIEKEIARKRRLIADGEKILKEVPDHLRPSQQNLLEMYKRRLAALEEELIRLKDKDFEND